MEEKMEIAIPTDSDGFVPLQCPLCCEYFKLTPSDINSDEILDLWCPYCGLKSDSYITDDVKDLALAMVQNKAMDLINKHLNQMSKNFNTKNLTIKSTNKLPYKNEERIEVSFDSLELYQYSCCKKEAKIKPLIKFSGGYCPFCGVSVDGD